SLVILVLFQAFGNAKTAHNNNSSRFGKFIQVNYKENGMVHGAVVQKYLLEKSRICSQGRGERNYHVFYYLLAGASDQDRHALHLKKIESYHYLNRSGPYTLDNVDEKYEFSRLQQSMEMVGFTQEKQRRLFAVLSAVLLLGNVEFVPRKSAYHHDESVTVRNTEVVALISELLRVKKETLLAALTAKHARASDETLVINYRLPEVKATVRLFVTRQGQTFHQRNVAKSFFPDLYFYFVFKLLFKAHPLTQLQWISGKCSGLRIRRFGFDPCQGIKFSSVNAW
ncbi:hypothetical protein WDU94_010478, partial [Cyamophila willieti]